MKFDDRACCAPLTHAVSVNRRGGDATVEVWANRHRFRLCFDRLFNLMTITRFVSSGHWRAEYKRAYPSRPHRRKRPLTSLHIDLVCCALDALRAERRA